MIRKLLLFVRSLFLNFSNSSKERSFLSSNRMLCLGMFFVVPFFTFGQSPATFNSSGTFTVPAGVTSITVECWGGGGAGGMNNETYKNGGGGGGGGYSKTTNITVTPLQSYSITVGTGGVPSASNGDGKPTSATFGVITVSALGGKGGTSAQPGIGGNGAALGTGAITYAGGNGSNGDNGEFGGGGGSSAGTGASGTTVGIPNPIGTGAIAPAGGGNGGNGFIGNSNSGGNGQPGSIPGGGGGGGRNGQIVFGTNRSGGAGANGQVIITYCNTTAPTGTVSQSFCSGASPTVANLAATGTAIKWYSASSGGSPLATSTALINGTHYYATQTVNGCESTSRFDVTATINTTPSAPTGTAGLSFCSGASPTVANLAATGTAIKWYSASSGGSPLANSTALTTGTHYYATQTVNGCESTSRFDVTATINTTPSAPTGTAGQSFCSGASPTVANLAATGTAIKWYSASSGGSPLASSTALATGTHYYATQTVNGCESTSRFDVTATINTTPSAPTGTSGQSFCSGASPTVGNLTATGTAIQWYAASSGGSPLASSTALATGTHYYATQTVNGCESTSRFDVTATINTTPSAPTGTAGQSFCSGASPTVANLAATGTAIKWYSASSGGSPLASSTALATGTHYYATQTVNGCESTSRFDVTATINTTPSAPTGTAGQSFCSGASPTVGNLTATGTAIRWYAASSGGSPLASSTALATGTHYYATQTVNGCESTSRFDVTATINTTPSAPTGTSGQSFCSGASPTVGNLTATGTAIQWYATSSGGSALATTTALTNGTHYYATQTANGCESTSRLDVTVTITPLPTVSPITGGATTVCTTLTTPAFTNATSGGTWSITPGTGSATIDDATGIVTAGNAGDVTVVYTVTSGSCQNTATATLTIKPNHPAPIVGTITRPTCSALGGSVTLSGLPASGNLFIDNGTTIVSRAFTSSTPTIDQLAPGTYYFALDNGCTAIYSAEVVILANTFTGGTSWTYGAPTSDDYVDFAANYIVSGDETYCSVRVSNGASVTVNSGVTLTVTNGVHVVSGSYLTFKNSSNLIQGNTSNTLNTGNINYERYAGKIRQADYVYWSTPVKNQTLAALSSSTSPSKLYAYDGMKWVFTPRTTIMDPAKGYIVRGPETFSNTSKSDFTGIFIGTPQNGTFAGEPMTAGQPYLLGNPYPSALDADAFITANSAIIEGSLYFWTHNTPVVLGGAYEYETDDYATYNLGGGVGTQAAPSEDDPKLNDPNLPADQLPNNSFPNGQVASGQAFFVKAYAQGSATFTNSMRSSKDIHGNNTNGQFFKPGKASKTAAIEKHRVWLNMTNAGGAFKQLLVAYVEGATNSYDRLYDGKTFDGNKFIDFYSINDNHKLVIQGRGLPFTDADQVPLGYRSTIAGDFTISIDHADGDMKTQAMYIEDKKTGKIHDLKAGKYTFTTEIGTFTDRLVLRYSNKSLGTGDFENVEKGITVSIKDKSVKVLSSNETIQDVTIFDVAGKLLYSKSKVGSNELQISNLQSSNQVLLVDITLDNGYKTTRKIIFQ